MINNFFKEITPLITTMTTSKSIILSVVASIIIHFLSNSEVARASTTMEVDIVYTWVDSSDPAWQQEYTKYNIL